MLKTYDPKAVSAVFAGILISGYADGTFINVSRNEDSFTMMVGADGDATRAKSNNKSGRVVFTVQQSAACNDLLSAALAADELLGGNGIGPLLIKDNSGRTLITAEKAWITKPADAPFAKDVSTREWTIETDALIMGVAGN